MRHRVYGKHLGRNKDQRKTLFKGLVYSLISSGTIQTSETKAKAIKGLVDKVINSAKSKNSAEFQSYISDKILRDRVTSEILPKLGTRTSGYTSMVKMGTRLGDQAMVVKMSLIGAEKLKPIQSESRVKSQESSKKSEQPLATAKKGTIKQKPLNKATKVSITKKGEKKS